MQKHIYIISLLLVISIKNYAQQSPVFADYNYNTVVINPAFAGYYKDVDLAFTYNQFMNDIEGTPQTNSLTANIPIQNQKMGFGLGVVNDKIGVLTTTTITASFAYRLKIVRAVHNNIWWDLNPKGLSFGMSAALINWNENLTNLGITNDPKFASDINESIPTFHVGAMYNDTHFFAGLSVNNLISGTVDSHQASGIQRVVYAHVGGRFFTSKYFEEILITPSILIKSEPNVPLQIDFNMLLNYKNKIELGVGYRSTAAVNAMLGFNINKHLNIMYQYNVNTDSLSPLGNSHGLMMRLRLGKGIPF